MLPINICYLLLLVCARCGCHMKAGLRIVGGREAKIEQYPWLAQVTLQEQPHCGGVIVSTRVVVTAAHCFMIEQKLLRPELFAVLVGSSISLSGTKHKPCKIYIHPYYGQNNYQTYAYDIAMVLLSTIIKIKKNVRIARLVPHNYWHKSGTIMTVAGYGCRSSYIPSTTLRKTYMRYVDREICSSKTSDDGLPMPVPDHMFCLIGSRNNSDCFGDSGSGVMWKSYVVGIVCTGREKLCGSNVYPSMYTDLYYFRMWISISVKKLETRTIGNCDKTGLYFGRSIGFLNKSMFWDYYVYRQSNQIPQSNQLQRSNQLGQSNQIWQGNQMQQNNQMQQSNLLRWSNQLKQSNQMWQGKDLRQSNQMRYSTSNCQLQINFQPKVNRQQRHVNRQRQRHRLRRSTHLNHIVHR